MKKLYRKGIAVLLVLLSVLSLCSCGAEAPEIKQEEPMQEMPAEEKKEEIPEEKPAPKEEKAETEEEPEEEPEEKETKTSLSGIRPEFQEAMDSYEQFYDEYCELMKEYKANPTDLELLSKSAELTSKSLEVSEKFEAWDGREMSLEETKLYLDVSVRVEKKLLEAMQ